MAERLRFAYDKEAISREIQDDFFVRLDPKTQKVFGFSILNFEKHFKGLDDYRLVPMSAEFSLS